MLQRIGAAGDAVDGEAGLAQPLLQVGAGFRFVFGDQQFHADIPSVVDGASVAAPHRCATKLTESNLALSLPSGRSR